MLDHLSYSSINTYHLCPRSWRLRYVDKVRTPSASALVFGGAFHDTLEAAIGALALDKVSVSEIAWLLKLWSEKWQAKLASEQVAWGENSPEELAILGARMLGGKLDVSGAGPNRVETMPQFLSKIVPMMVDAKPDFAGVEPAIERKISLSVPGVPVSIIGYIDIITADGVPGDFKTSDKAWYADKANDELQPFFYLAALAQAGTPVPDGKFYYYIFTKTQKPKAQILVVKHTVAEMLWLFEYIKDTWEAIQAGVFPTRGGTFKCRPHQKPDGTFNKYYCEHWQVCRGR